MMYFLGIVLMFSLILVCSTSLISSNPLKMSGGFDILAMKEDDVTKMLSAGVHLGDSNVNFQMEQYIYKVRSDGECFFT